VVLIGMPGCGKSTAGVLLAKRTARGFVDTDLLVQAAAGCTLQQYVDAAGQLALRALEERVLLGLGCAGHVVATGGSAVYSTAAMAHLRAGGRTVFLDVDLPALAARLRDFATRGVARRPGQGLAELYDERRPLYLGHADLVIDCRGLSHEEVCARIIEATGTASP
jgi:shikimate kinase